jgi:Tfp pilus assembly protein PilV
MQAARRSRRAGFSLLEVILALATLAGSVVVLGEVNRLALRNAAAARDLSRAQMLCESKMAEVVSGITAATQVSKTPFDAEIEAAAEDDSRWVFSIDTQTTDEEELIAVRVTVTKDLPPEQHPVEFSLVRWMQDPNAASQQSSSDSTSNSNSNSGSNTNSSGGTSNGGS